LKRADEALASYDKAIAIRPNYPEAFNQPRQGAARTQAAGRGAGEL